MTEESVLATLRRVPDRIILATMGREYDEWSNSSCLCGWFVREKLAEIQNVGASTTTLPTYPVQPGQTWVPGVRNSHEVCAEMFGGSVAAWEDIWMGVTNGEVIPVIERAFVRRVDEAVNPPRRRRSRKLSGV